VLRTRVSHRNSIPSVTKEGLRLKGWQRIRLARTDLTDYVIHFTKLRSDVFNKKTPEGRPFLAHPFDVFCEILDDGFIRPTFAPIRSLTAGTTSNTVRGPVPAVCLTEQPLSAVLVTQKCAGGRYSGFGVAYHKYALFCEGGRPVIYGSKPLLGKRIQSGDVDYEDGKEIFAGGLPKELQYLFVQYKPTIEFFDDHPIDFTWEREWRITCRNGGLPVHLDRNANLFKSDAPAGALVVERDEQVSAVRDRLAKIAEQGKKWATQLTRIVSLETSARMLAAGDSRYSRIETWPE
jgi:hypothetical protein